MKLYWGPHTCAIGIHILLEELGRPYETEKLDVAGGATHAPAFLAINPKGKVPTLVRDDGSVLTEFGAIATWLARTSPEAGLIPEDADAEGRMVEMLGYVEGTIHGQGFGRIFAPGKFEPQDVVHQATGLGSGSVRRQGREMVEQGFAILDPQLAGHDFAVGDTLTIADFALFYVERWAPQQDIALPANLQRHFDRMLARPAVQTVRAAWGEA
ncbi:glutathione S-transferase family protein [Sphingomonas profundi]|uniref:glutathione S-transferase family protein n=1 Tax=Alterirhizorhabdus profundi TaxID=2681549 RepID=UPI0012E81AF0|nr:glutathione S-transferase family protein [Sphingomonas profundi]